MKLGDQILFTGWRLKRGKEIWVANMPATIIDIDDLSSVSCAPDRYIIRFNDNEEMDCTRTCLIPVDKPEDQRLRAAGAEPLPGLE